MYIASANFHYYVFQNTFISEAVQLHCSRKALTINLGYSQSLEGPTCNSAKINTTTQRRYTNIFSPLHGPTYSTHVAAMAIVHVTFYRDAPSVCTHSDYPTRIGRFGTGIALQLSHRDYHIANVALKPSHHGCHIPTDASHIALIAQRIAHHDHRVIIVA